MNRKQKARQIAERLSRLGHEADAKRLVEAFELDAKFEDGENLDIDQEASAELDDVEVNFSARELERYIPASATMPELDDERSMSSDITGVFRRTKLRQRRRRRG